MNSSHWYQNPGAIHFSLVYDLFINLACISLLSDLHVILENLLGRGNFMRIYYQIHYTEIFVT